MRYLFFLKRERKSARRKATAGDPKRIIRRFFRTLEYWQAGPEMNARKTAAPSSQQERN